MLCREIISGAFRLGRRHQEQLHDGAYRKLGKHSSAYARQEQLLEAFEAAWKGGERPAVADYLPPGTMEPELLLDFLQADLACRL